MRNTAKFPTLTTCHRRLSSLAHRIVIADIDTPRSEEDCVGGDGRHHPLHDDHFPLMYYADSLSIVADVCYHARHDLDRSMCLPTLYPGLALVSGAELMLVAGHSSQRLPLLAAAVSAVAVRF